MSLPRFFPEDLALDEGSTVGERLRFEGADARHARRVLRLRPGESLVLCKGDGADYICQIDSLTETGFILALRARRANPCETGAELTLWQALPKGGKMDEIIEKSVELGVCRIVPLESARSLVRLEAARGKLERWRRIAASAAKQSGRAFVPEVAAPLAWEEALARLSDELGGPGAGGAPAPGAPARAAEVLGFIPWESAEEPTLPALLRGPEVKPAELERVHFLIGPEGGLDAEEVAAARGAGLIPVSLGRRILRTETAGPAVLAMLNALLPNRM